MDRGKKKPAVTVTRSCTQLIFFCQEVLIPTQCWKIVFQCALLCLTPRWVSKVSDLKALDVLLRRVRLGEL